MKAGDEGSQALYPRASKVLRKPPLGKDDASGSCWERRFPLKYSKLSPSRSGLRKASCFSAVESLRGWNQWV